MLARGRFNPDWLRRLLNAQPVAGNCELGFASGLRPKAGFAPAVILSRLPEESKGKMTCKRCNHAARKFGRYGKRQVQRYRCTTCKITFSEYEPKLGNHYTAPEVAAKALAMMLEGMSVRAISRLTGLHKHTILALMNTASERATEKRPQKEDCPARSHDVHSCV